jgi:hypothetical protein
MVNSCQGALFAGLCQLVDVARKYIACPGGCTVFSRYPVRKSTLPLSFTTQHILNPTAVYRHHSARGTFFSVSKNASGSSGLKLSTPCPFGQARFETGSCRSIHKRSHPAIRLLPFHPSPLKGRCYGISTAPNGYTR